MRPPPNDGGPDGGPDGESDGDPDGGPVVIPPPGFVRIAALLVIAQGLGLWVLATMTAFSGFSHDANTTQLVAQVLYFIAIGGLLCLVASGLLRGRRWGRTPALVAQVVLVAIGMWMAFPSGQLPQGLALIGLGVLTFVLLVTPRANHWIRQFPRPFGLEFDRGRS